MEKSAWLKVESEGESARFVVGGGREGMGLRREGRGGGKGEFFTRIVGATKRAVKRRCRVTAGAKSEDEIDDRLCV